jgi:small-conductance mechanosensitive channel
MDYIKELKELLESDVLLEIDESINELEYQIKQTKKNKNFKEELEYMQQIKQYFQEVIKDIENNSITQNQALDILEGLEDMKTENQEV